MFRRFLKEEKGQSTVEYLLIIAVVVVVVSVLGKQLQGRLPGVIDKVFGNVNKSIDGLFKGAAQ